jgi:DNA-binding PadR family transcriptional regulator
MSQILSSKACLILFALAERDMHGYAIMREVEALTGGSVRIGPGTLYGALKRMIDDGLIVEIEGGADARRRPYRLTSLGRRVAEEELARAQLLSRVGHARLRPAKA